MGVLKSVLLLSFAYFGNRLGNFGVAFAAAQSEESMKDTEDFIPPGRVTEIVTDIFSAEKQEDVKPHFVLFYAPWCGHCKRLHPTWESLAEKYNKEDSSVVIGKVDCTSHQAICASQDVNGYPTLKFLLGSKSGGVKYKGARDFDSLEKFILKQLDVSDDDEEYENLPPPAAAVSGLVELNDDNFKEIVDKGAHFIKFYAPWCGHCQRLVPAWTDLAKSFEDEKSVTISKIDCTKHNTFCREYEVKGYPTLLWIEDGKKIAKYSGDRSPADLHRFVTEQLGERGVKKESEEAVTEEKGSVVVLTSENFENAIKEGITLVKFYAPWCGHCKRMAPTYNEVGDKFIGIPQATIAKVDCTQDINKDLCAQEQVNGFPTLLLYRNGEKLAEYEGDRTLDDMVDFVYEKLGHDEL